MFGLVLLAAVGAGEALRAWARWKPESSRRFVHTSVGVATALCPPFFESPGGIYALALLFIGVNLVAVPRRLFPGMHAISRPSWGTVAFPVALVVALWLCWTLDPGRVYILQAAFLVLAVSDSLASWVGERAPRPGRFVVHGQTKSVAGSAAFALSAVALTAGALAVWGPEAWGAMEVAAGALTAGGLATAAELLGKRGWDNLFIVLAVIVALALLDARPDAAWLSVVALFVAVVFGVAALRAGALDLSGALAASLLAWAVVAVGGPAWAVPAVVFFVASSLLSRVGHSRKAEAEARAEKGSQRDAGQVLANGGVGGALLTATLFAPDPWTPVLYVAFVGAFAAAAADTWATEIGTLIGGATRDVLRWRPVAPGESGGVSAGGTLGAVLGAGAVAGSAWPWMPQGIASPGVLLGVLVAAGVAGSLLDSLLGATVQARYADPSGGLTERREVGGVALARVRGWRGVDNDRVNLACTLAGAVLAALVVGL